MSGRLRVFRCIGTIENAFFLIGGLFVFWISELLIVIQMYAYNSMAGGGLFVSFAVSFKPEDTYWWQAWAPTLCNFEVGHDSQKLFILFKCK